MRPHQYRGRRWWIIIGALGLLVLCVGILGYNGRLDFLGPSSDGPTDMEGHPVARDAGSRDAIDPSAEAAGEGRFVVDSVGLDVPLGSMKTVGGTIDPPGFTSAYVVRDLGVPLSDARDGTVYVAAHSLRGGGTAPGNYLIDVDAGTPRVAAGDSIVVGPRTYVVTDAFAVGKSDLAARADIWEDAPGRLVVVTCLQREDGSLSQENVIVEASLQKN